MRRVLILLATAVMATLVGCQTTSNAQKKSDAATQQFQAGVADQSACMQRIKSKNTGAFAIVSEQVMFLNPTASNKMALLANTKKINKVQSEALTSVLTSASECRSIWLTAIAGTPPYQPYVDYYTSLDILYAKLLSKQLTIGKFNQERSQLESRRMNSIQTAAAQFDRNMADEHNQEMAQRQRAAAAMSGYMLQQQALQQQQQAIQQQNSYNQQMLMLQQQQNSQMNQSVNTNCIRYGSQINCTTR